MKNRYVFWWSNVLCVKHTEKAKSLWPKQLKDYWLIPVYYCVVQMHPSACCQVYSKSWKLHVVHFYVAYIYFNNRNSTKYGSAVIALWVMLQNQMILECHLHPDKWKNMTYICPLEGKQNMFSHHLLTSSIHGLTKWVHLEECQVILLPNIGNSVCWLILHFIQK